MHGVEQSPPNSRKKPATAAKQAPADGEAAKCSTCSAVFGNAQDFYDHLDDCVLKSLEQEEPSEAINQQHLTEVSADKSVQETMQKNQILTFDNAPAATGDEEEDEGEDEDEEEDDGEEDKADGGKTSSRRDRC